MMSLHNVPKATGGNWLLLCEVNTTFFNFLRRYVTFLQQKCGDYEIMQALHISFNLCRNLQFMQGKCGIFEKMRPRINVQTLADYALNYAIAESRFSGGTV